MIFPDKTSVCLTKTYADLKTFLQDECDAKLTCQHLTMIAIISQNRANYNSMIILCKKVKNVQRKEGKPT